MGLDVYLYSRPIPEDMDYETSKQFCVEIDSKIDKDHYFKVGYWRSSYNNSGINSFARNIGIDGLYEVAGCNDDTPYEFAPDWAKVKERALAAAAKIREHAASDRGKYRIFFEGVSIFASKSSLPSSEKSALDMFFSELPSLSRDNANADFSNYSNGKGMFSRVGLLVRGVLPGIGGLGEPGCYIVYEASADDKLEWYAKAFEIVAETAEYVLSQPNPSTYRLHWSS